MIPSLHNHTRATVTKPSQQQHSVVPLSTHYKNGKSIKPKRREMIAWTIVVLQSIAFSMYVATSSSSSISSFVLENNDPYQSTASSAGSGVEESMRLSSNNAVDNEYTSSRKNRIDHLKMNNHPNTCYQQRRMDATMTTTAMNTDAAPTDMNKDTSYYEQPIMHPKDIGLVSRIWHSNGSPSINSDLHQGSCWCSFDEWCLCTPALAIDLIIESGYDHIWVVRRQDTDLLALMGGFTEVGETSLETVGRELMEEMNLKLETQPILFGVYNDPLRDTRRHATSVVFIISLPEGIQPRAGDDAKSVTRIPLADVKNRDFFVDHKTIINDYMKMKQRKHGMANGDVTNIPPIPQNGDEEPFKRAICPID
jgi:ADP-ribose pyrophosphatase YjhB (NUDIX family)